MPEQTDLGLLDPGAVEVVGGERGGCSQANEAGSIGAEISEAL